MARRVRDHAGYGSRLRVPQLLAHEDPAARRICTVCVPLAAAPYLVPGTTAAHLILRRTYYPVEICSGDRWQMGSCPVLHLTILAVPLRTARLHMLVLRRKMLIRIASEMWLRTRCYRNSLYA